MLTPIDRLPVYGTLFERYMLNLSAHNTQEKLRNKLTRPPEISDIYLWVLIKD